MTHLVSYPPRSFLLACEPSTPLCFQDTRLFRFYNDSIVVDTALPLLLLLIFVSNLDFAHVCFISFFMKILMNFMTGAIAAHK